MTRTGVPFQPFDLPPSTLPDASGKYQSKKELSCMSLPRSVQYERHLEASPSLRRLRTTNFPASEEEASHIRHAILPSIEADISSMSAQIVALRAMLLSVERERNALKAVHGQYKNLIHPRRAVPPELWSEIFLLADYNIYKKSDACDPSGYIWAISHVCQPWRDIALSLQSFWSKLFVGWMPSTAEILECVLQRTGQHPLDVTFDNYKLLGPSQEAFHALSLSTVKARVFGMLFAESHRWRKFAVFDYRQDQDTLYAPLLGRLPQLELLSLHFTQAMAPRAADQTQPLILAFSDCPRLTRVVLTGERRHVDLPYARITDLSIADDVEPLVDKGCWTKTPFIDQCTSLRKLRIVGCWDSAHFNSSRPPLLVHPNLRYLETGCVHLIDRLTLPQLEAAVLFREQEWDDADFLPSFDRLLQRSNCTSLTRLDLIDMVLADHLLISVLSQTPNLTSLHLIASMADSLQEPDRQAMQEVRELIQALRVVPQRNTTFLPRVTSVKIHLSEHLDSSGFPYFGPSESFSSMLQARWEGDTEQGSARLETFHLSLSVGLVELPFLDDTDERLLRLSDDVGVDVLSGLVDDGMDLTVLVRTGSEREMMNIVSRYRDL